MSSWAVTSVSLRIQERVLRALVMREILTRFGRANLGFAWLFVEPMLFTGAITALWFAIGLTHVPREHVIAFGITGYSTVLLWRNAASRCTNAVETNLGLLYHKDITVTDIFAARVILELAGATASFLLLSTIMVTLGLMSLPEDPLRVAMAWVLLAWFGGAFALVVGSMAEMSSFFERLWHPLAYILFVISGAMFMVDWLPDEARDLVLLFPMVHGVEALRNGYFGEAVHTHEDLQYLVTLTLAMTMLGLSLARLVNYRVEPK